MLRQRPCGLKLLFAFNKKVRIRLTSDYNLTFTVNTVWKLKMIKLFGLVKAAYLFVCLLLYQFKEHKGLFRWEIFRVQFTKLGFSCNPLKILKLVRYEGISINETLVFLGSTCAKREVVKDTARVL